MWDSSHTHTHHIINQIGASQFVCGCVMSPTSGIYWVDLGFINNYKESLLWLVLLRYSANVTSAFPWIITYSIRAGLVTPCGLGDTTHKVGPNEDIRDLSGGDCDALIWLIVCDVCRCVMSSTSGIYWVDLNFINNYKESQLGLVILRYSADVASAFPWVCHNPNPRNMN